MDESHSGAVDSWVGAAQEVATEAAQKAADSSAYVQEQLSAMDDSVRDYTGKPLSGWAEDLRALVRERPLASATLIIAVGLVAAKLMRR
jgi:hypothetical protein